IDGGKLAESKQQCSDQASDQYQDRPTVTAPHLRLQQQPATKHAGNGAKVEAQLMCVLTNHAMLKQIRRDELNGVQRVQRSGCREVIVRNDTRRVMQSVESRQELDSA